MNEDQISWALSRVVPAMESSVTIDTSYGGLVLEGDDAKRVQAVVENLLRAKLRKAQEGAK